MNERRRTSPLQPKAGVVPVIDAFDPSIEHKNEVMRVEGDVQRIPALQRAFRNSVARCQQSLRTARGCTSRQLLLAAAGRLAAVRFRPLMVMHFLSPEATSSWRWSRCWRCTGRLMVSCSKTTSWLSGGEERAVPMTRRLQRAHDDSCSLLRERGNNGSEEAGSGKAAA